MSVEVPRAVLGIVTATPMMGLPLLSLTVPVIFPPPCAKVLVASTVKTNAATKNPIRRQRFASVRTLL